ncbi:MAG TPA: DUF2298 domain-containing protein [Dehalococcoidia bacterium]|nr:DUF2298 domain-containing protein [Dehalococcoidia bacterium]
MSEQTSPLHDQAVTRVTVAGRALPRLRLNPAAIELSRTVTAVALFAILLLGGFLRLTDVNWDASSGPWNTSGAPAISGHLHPDERFLTQIATDTRAPSSIANYFDSTRSPLNPYNIQHPDGSRQTTFVYGTLPLFLTKFAARYAALPSDVVHTLTFGAVSAGPLTTHSWDNYDQFNLVGRVLSALFDLGTIVAIFFIGWRLASRGVGLLAAFLYAVAAFPIQNAHFFIVDPFMTFFATVAILFAVRAAQDGGRMNVAIAGAAAGLGAACKVTAISLFPVIVLAIGVHEWPGIKPYVAPWWTGGRADAVRDGRRLDAAVVTIIVGSLIVAAAGFIAFRIAMPYAFKTPSLADLFTLRESRVWKFPLVYPDILSHHWLQDQSQQRTLLSASASWPPNVQWIGRSKWIWPLQQMVSWGMGPAFGITAWAGVVFAAVYAWRRRAGVWLVPLAWVGGYFGFMGAQFSLYMRYFLPLYPMFAVLAAFLLTRVWSWAASEGMRSWTGWPTRLRAAGPTFGAALRIGAAAVVVMTLLWGLAFYNIYRSPISRASASKWIYENVPAGSVIGHESWDDSVPYAVAGVPPVAYGSVEFNNFNADTADHVAELLSDLDQADYIALASARASRTVTREPAFWPVTSRYYAALADGTLGFQKVAEFTSYPSILGISFNDTAAEESWSVYDHPQVTIYRKTSVYSHARAVQVLHADHYVAIPATTPGNEAQNGLLFTPGVLATQQAGGTWSDLFHPGDLVNSQPLFFWLLAVELAAFALVPLAAVCFRGLPDRGFLLTKPLGIFALAYLVYAPASYGATQFTRAAIAVALGLMIVIGIGTAAWWRRELAAWVRTRWRFILFAESVFLLAFLFSYWIRLQNPDLFHPINGGEKPMDFAYFNGAIRTTDLTQGPIDPWYAGGYMNYYWYGQYIAATVTKLTGIVPEVAYNLAVPMFFSFLAAATFSVAYNLAEATRRLMKRRPGGLPISAAGPILTGLGAIFLVLIAGNLKAVGILEQSLAVQSHWHSLFGLHPPFVTGMVEMVGGFKEILFGDGSFGRLFLPNAVGHYDWWAPSRALSVVNPQTEVQPITEFPFWTFLFADLHAHLMAMPFAMTAVGVALGVVLNFTRADRDGQAQGSDRTRELGSWAMVALLGVIIGGLRWINSWDYPPFLLLAGAALILAERAKRGRFTPSGIGMGVLKSLVMGALSYAFFARFAHNYSQAYTGIEQSTQTTAVSDYLAHFGIPLFLITGFLLFNLNRSITRTNFVRGIFFGRARRRRAAETAPVMVALVLAGAAVIYAGAMQRWGVTALAGVGLVAVCLAGYREVRSSRATAPVMLFVYAMIALGLGLSGGVELVTLQGDVGRMNTVFKFYLHVWMLWGVVGAFSLWYVFGVMQPHAAFLRRVGAVNASVIKAPRYAFAVAAAPLLALALVFPYFGTRARIHDRFNPAQGTSNNGLAFMAKGGIYAAHYDATGIDGQHNMLYTLDGINWIREHIKGTPTTFEAIGPSYRSLGSRVAIYTGLPTVSGWVFHEEQQRVKFAQTVQQRQADVNEFYSTTSVGRARDLIRKYDVQWVIVGDEEQFNYPAAGLAKFNNGLGGALELAYQNPGMQIWHVIPQAELAAAAP